MQKRKTIISVFIAVAAIATITISLSKILTSSSFAKATGEVPHEITFTYADIDSDDFLSDGSYCTGMLQKKTDANNTFCSDDLEIIHYSAEGLSFGDIDHQYLFKINHAEYPYYADSTTVFSIYFDMKVDVADSVTAIVNRSFYYNDGENTSVSTESESFDVLTDNDLDYYIGYELKFTNKYYTHVTINYIQINYSCTY